MKARTLKLKIAHRQRAWIANSARPFFQRPGLFRRGQGPTSMTGAQKYARIALIVSSIKASQARRAADLRG